MLHPTMNGDHILSLRQYQSNNDSTDNETMGDVLILRSSNINPLIQHLGKIQCELIQRKTTKIIVDEVDAQVKYRSRLSKMVAENIHETFSECVNEH